MIVSGYVGGAKMVAKEKIAKAQKMMLAINYHQKCFKDFP